MGMTSRTVRMRQLPLRCRSYQNSFVTHHTLSDDTVVEVILASRTQWKVENENNNTLKTKGYNLVQRHSLILG